MKRCVKCNVNVRGDQEKCPLCQAELTGKAEAPLYPKIQTIYRQHASLLRLVLLTSISVCVLSAAINLLLPGSGRWALYVFVGMVCFWVCLLSGIRAQHNIPQNITNQSLFISAIGLLWDWLTGWHGWSIDYVVPIAFAASMAIMAIMTRVRKIPVEDYIVCLAIDAVFGIIPLFFYLTNRLDQPIPSLICISLSAISLAAILILHWKEIRHALERRIHI